MREKRIFWIIVFNLIIIVSEFGFGWIANSFALIADALHNVGDVIAVVITYLALRLSGQRASFEYTFGFMRAEMMAGFVNTLFLFVTMFYLIYEATLRLFEPQVVEPLTMMVVGSIAVVANGVSAYLLHTMGVASCSHGEGTPTHEHTHTHEDTNIKSAYLHMLADALISVGVVVAGGMIYLFEIYRIDAVLTILFSLFILFHSYPLLKRSFSSLMDINVGGVDRVALEEAILVDERVAGYHDLHLHQPSSKDHFISFHLVLKDATIPLHDSHALTTALKQRLEQLGFNHIVIQVETTACHRDHIYCIKEP